MTDYVMNPNWQNYQQSFFDGFQDLLAGQQAEEYDNYQEAAAPVEDNYNISEELDPELLSNYEDLQSRYDDLQSRYDEQQAQVDDDMIYNMIFADRDDNEPIDWAGVNQQIDINPESIKVTGKWGNQNVGNYGRQIIGDLTNSFGYTPQINSIYRDQAQQDQLVKQGVGVKNSYHLSGDAVDIPLAEWNKLAANKKDALRNKYDVVVHNGHAHFEPKPSFQMGGAVANDPTTQYFGLNNPYIGVMHFPLEGENTFRGLDNGQPVFVTDGKKSKVLKGNKDKSKFSGNVTEFKL